MPVAWDGWLFSGRLLLWRFLAYWLCHGQGNGLGMMWGFNSFMFWDMCWSICSMSFLHFPPFFEWTWILKCATSSGNSMNGSQGKGRHTSAFLCLLSLPGLEFFLAFFLEYCQEIILTLGLRTNFWSCFFVIFGYLGNKLHFFTLFFNQHHFRFFLNYPKLQNHVLVLFCWRKCEWRTPQARAPPPIDPPPRA